jgi:phosphonate transport system ATP-binding protein
VNAPSQPITAADARAPVAVSVRQLGKSFASGRPVFEGVSFDVAEGSIVALLGVNGAGKSTLLRCLPHLIAPSQGDIHVFGEPLPRTQATLRRLRGRMGFVFQKHNLVGRLSALSNVVQGAQAKGHGMAAWFQSTAPHALRRDALSCLARVGLAHLAGQRADSLSGGQSQRVAIARALMQKPDVVLADEPAASLDPQAGDEVMQLFSALMREEKKTVLFTSHNLDHALRFADRIIVLGGGQIVFDGPSHAIAAHELRKLYA